MVDTIALTASTDYVITIDLEIHQHQIFIVYCI